MGTLMISVPKGRKDLTEGIQIVEKIIGPVEYLDDDKKESYQAARNRKGGKQFYTVDLNLDSELLQQIGIDEINESEEEDEDDIKINRSLNSIFSSSSRRKKRGASLLSDSKKAKSSKTPKGSKIKLSEQSEIQRRKKTRRFSDEYVNVLRKNQEKSALQSMNRSTIDDESILYDDDEEEQDDADNNAEQLILPESNRRRGSTVVTNINIEQEWDDFDEIMTQDSWGYECKH